MSKTLTLKNLSLKDIKQAVKADSYITGQIDKSVDVVKNAQLAFNEQAGDEQYHEIKIFRTIKGALAKFEASISEFVETSNGSAVVSDTLTQSTDKFDIIITVNNRMTPAFATTMAYLAQEYIINMALYYWWQPIKPALAKDYAAAAESNLIDVKRCLAKSAPYASVTSYNDITGTVTPIETEQTEPSEPGGDTSGGGGDTPEPENPQVLYIVGNASVLNPPHQIDGNANITTDQTIHAWLAGVSDGSLSYQTSGSGEVGITQNHDIYYITPVSGTVLITFYYGSHTWTLVVTKQEQVELVSPNISWPASEYSTNTEGYVENFPLNNPHNVPVSYSSSDENGEIAIIDPFGVITILGPGTCTITATSTATNTYSSQTVSFTLTVTEPQSDEPSEPGGGDDPNTGDDPNNGNNESEIVYPTVLYKIGSAGSVQMTAGTPVSITTDDEVLVAAYGGSGGTFSCQASGSGEANVEDEGENSLGYYTFAITPLSGTKTLTFSYADRTWVVNLTRETEQSGSNQGEPLIDPNLSWSADSFTATAAGVASGAPTLNNPSSLEDVLYETTNPAVATINQNGVLTIVGNGTCTVTAYVQETEDHLGDEAQYTLTVNIPAAVTPESPELSWSTNAYHATGTGAQASAPTLTNPHNVTVNYSSSDTSVATVNQNGEVTVLGYGYATISAVSEATNEYESQTVSYQIDNFPRVAIVNNGVEDFNSADVYLQKGQTASFAVHNGTLSSVYANYTTAASGVNTLEITQNGNNATIKALDFGTDNSNTALVMVYFRMAEQTTGGDPIYTAILIHVIGPYAPDGTYRNLNQGDTDTITIGGAQITSVVSSNPTALSATTTGGDTVQISALAGATAGESAKVTIVCNNYQANTFEVNYKVWPAAQAVTLPQDVIGDLDVVSVNPPAVNHTTEFVNRSNTEKIADQYLILCAGIPMTSQANTDYVQNLPMVHLSWDNNQNKYVIRAVTKYGVSTEDYCYYVATDYNVSETTAPENTATSQLIAQVAAAALQHYGFTGDNAPVIGSALQLQQGENVSPIPPTTHIVIPSNS